MILAASFALTNCAVEQTGSNDRFDEGIPYEILALSSDTKTAVDGMSTKWVAGDAVNLFHAVAGTADYVSDNSFAIAEADLADGRFKGTLSSALDAGESYDWYALYPYSSYVTTPASTSGGYVNIGGKSQTQNGLNSMAHLAVKACPLYGVALDVPSDAVPSIQMHHLTSIIEINVTNSCGEPLDVTSVSFTGTEDIAGNFYVDFVSNPVVGYVGNYASATASLSVTGAEPIADGASAKFYIAVKPFTAPAGSTLKIAVNGYEKELEIPAEKSVTFSAGKIKTLNFGYDKTPVKIESGSYVLAVKDGESYYAMSVAKNASSTRRDFVEFTDYTGQDSYETPNADIIWNVESQESGVILSNGDSFLSAGKNTAPMVTDKESASVISYMSLSETTFQFTYDLGGTDGVRYLAKNGTSGFGFYAQGTGINEIMLIPAVFVNIPIIVVAEADMSKTTDSSEATVEIPYYVTNPQDGVSLAASSSQTWAVPTVMDDKVSVVVSRNTGEARTATITLSYEDAENVTVTINQSVSGLITYRHVFAAKPSIGDNIDLSGVNWNISATNLGSYNSASYAGVQFGTSGKNGQITLTSPAAWSYTKNEETVSKVKEIRLWLNMGGTSVTPQVSIGEKSAVSDGTTVVKNTSAGSDWTKATKVTFTPAEGGDSGVIVIDVTSVKAGYICAIEIDSIN